MVPHMGVARDCVGLTVVELQRTGEASNSGTEAHTNTKQQKLNMTVLTSKPRGVSVVE